MISHSKGADLSAIEEFAKVCPRSRLIEIATRLACTSHIHNQLLIRKEIREVATFNSRDEILGHSVLFDRESVFQKVLDGQIRLIPLTRLVKGEESIDMLTVLIELSFSYAHQNNWGRVKEALEVGYDKLNRLLAAPHIKNLRIRVQRAHRAASTIVNFLQVIRTHVLETRAGGFQADALNETFAALEAVVESDSGYLPYSSGDLFETVKRYLNACRSDTSLLEWTQLIAYLRVESKSFRSYFEVVEQYFVPTHLGVLSLVFRHSVRRQAGFARVEDLRVAVNEFPACQAVYAGTKITKQLQSIAKGPGDHFPPLTWEEYLSVVVLEKILAAAPEQAQQQQSTQTSAVDPDSKTHSGRPLVPGPALPGVMENIDSDSNDLNDCGIPLEVPLAKVQLLHLEGVTQIFNSGDLVASERKLKQAIGQLEKLGLDREVFACGLYESVAELMMVKFRLGEKTRKRLIRRAAARYVQTREGKAAVEEQAKILRADAARKTAEPGFMAMKKRDNNIDEHASLETEAKARKQIIKLKTAELEARDISIDSADAAAAGASAPSSHKNKNLGAAYRYLVLLLDILENSFGPTHISCCSTCLKIAALQSLAGKFVDSRFWLSKAIRGLQKIEPQPLQALASAKVQLQQILSHEGYHVEALAVLQEVATFYGDSVKDSLIRYRAENPFEAYIVRPFIEGNPLHDEVQLALELMSRAVYLAATASARERKEREKPGAGEGRNGGGEDKRTVGGGGTPTVDGAVGNILTGAEVSTKNAEQSRLLTARLVKFVELVFGPDSLDHAAARRELALTCAAVGDAAAAIRNFKLSLQAFKWAVGMKDPRYVETLKAYELFQQGMKETG